MVASTWRYIFAVIGLLSAIYFFKDYVNFKAEFSTSRIKWPYLVLISLSGIFFFNYFFFRGLSETLAVNGSLIIAMNPAITFVLSVLFLKGVMKRKHVLGIVISLVGVVIVIFKGSLSNVFDLNVYSGDIYMLAATLLFAMHHILIQKFIPGINAFVLTIVTSVIGLACFLIFNGYELYILDYSTLDATFWLSIVCMGVAGTTFSFVVWNIGVIELGASKVSMFLNLIPVWAAITGLFFGNEITFFQLVGGIFIISGIYLTLKKRKKGVMV